MKPGILQRPRQQLDREIPAGSVSRLRPAGYSQSLKGLEDHYDSIKLGHLPVYRGIELPADDLLRRKVCRSDSGPDIIAGQADAVGKRFLKMPCGISYGNR